MHFKIPNHLFLLVAVAGLLGMGCSSSEYWLLVAQGNHGLLAGAVSPSSPTEREPSSRVQDSDAEVSSSSSPPKSAARNLDDVLEIKSLSEQQLALHIFLSDLDEAQVDDLLTQSQDVFPEEHRYELQFPILQRLAHQNPSRALSRVLEMYTGYEYMRAVTNVFREWAHSNLNEAVSRARTLDPIPRGLALGAIVHTRMDLAESTLRTIARDLGAEHVATSAIVQRRIDRAIEDPENAWNEWAINLQEDMANTETIARIGKAWVEKSGLSVLDQIYQSLTYTETRQRVIRIVLERVAQSDPAGAFNFALTIENDRHHSIVRELAGIWADSDPRSALTAIAGIESVSVRNAAADVVIRAWAQSKPREMLEGFDSLPADLQEKVAKAALSTLTKEHPEEAAQLVAAMESSSFKTTSAKSVVSVWSLSDHHAALEWILNEPGVEEIRSTLLFSILSRLLEVDPLLATTTVLDRIKEEKEKEIGRLEMMKEERELMSSSSSDDTNLELAIDLLPRVQKGLTRLDAFKEIAEELIRNDEIDRAFSLARQVADSDEQYFHIALAVAWAETDHEGLLNSINRFQSRAVRSRVAFMLLDNSSYREGLSDEQVENAKKYLSEEDAKALEEGDQPGLLPPALPEL